MIDRRELILSRLFSVLQGVMLTWNPPNTNVFRNQDELPPELRPGILMLDMDEEADKQEFDRNRPPHGPNFIRLVPEIYIALDVRKPQNINTGQDLNLLRTKILYAVLLDGTLASYVAGIGEIHYDGCITDLARGREMDGQMGLRITFKYPLFPPELGD